MPHGGRREGAGRKPKGTPQNFDRELQGLDPRRAHYVENRLAGQTKKDAALGAGFPASVAEHPGAEIETPEVRRALQKAIRAAIPPEKIIQRLAEGLDAEQSQVLTLGGVNNMRTEVLKSPDFRERREYLKLAAEYGGYHVQKQEIEVQQRYLDPAARAARIAELLRVCNVSRTD
jgi:hypothetical protein